MKVTNEPVDGRERENWLIVLPSSAIAIVAAITVSGAAIPAVATIVARSDEGHERACGRPRARELADRVAQQRDRDRRGDHGQRRGDPGGGHDRRAIG